MKRILVLSTLLLWFSTYLISINSYKIQVGDYRKQVASNASLPAKEAWFGGVVESYDLSKETMIFKTASPYTDRMIKYVIHFRGNHKLSTILANGTYHLKLLLNSNEMPYKAPKNQSGFDYDLYLFAKGIRGQFSLIDVQTLENPRQCLHCHRMAFRQEVAAMLQENFNLETAGLLKAFVLGDHTDFIHYDTYKDIGLAHIFAISGLHFGIIYHLIHKFLFLPVRWMKSIVIIIIMGIFLFWIGESYSAQRAFWIILYTEYGKTRGKFTDPLTSIAFSSVMILILAPWAILSTSFQLSFYAYIIIVVFIKSWSFMSIITSNTLLRTFEFSVLVQILLAPSALNFFLFTNLFGFLANLIIVPFVGFLMPLGFLATFLNQVGLSFFMNRIMEKFTAFMSLITTIIPVQKYSIPGYERLLFTMVLIIIATSTFLKSIHIKRFIKNRVMILSGILVILFLFTPKTYYNSRKLNFVDVGHGDFSFFQYGDRAIVIDTGDRYQNSAQHLSQSGVVYVDALILSHAHQDHIGGTENILSYYTPGVIIGNQETLNAIAPTNQNIYVANHVLDFSWHEIDFKIIPFKSDSDENNHALVLEFDYESIKGYFLGDVGNEVLQKIDFEKNIDFIKVPHHGSKSSNFESLYANSTIDYAIVSNNYKYNMPHPSVERLIKTHVETSFSTYRTGGISFTLIPGNISYKTFLSDID